MSPIGGRDAIALLAGAGLTGVISLSGVLGSVLVVGFLFYNGCSLRDRANRLAIA